MLTELRLTFHRDLDALHREIAMYPDDASVWAEPPGCPNSAGTLTLHMCGNLRHYIGAQLGGSSYVRDREAEFGDRDLPRHELQGIVEATRDEVDRALGGLKPDALDAPFQMPMLPEPITVGLWLLHLGVHLSYHLGQLDYHRRLVTGDATAAGAMAPAALV